MRGMVRRALVVALFASLTPLGVSAAPPLRVEFQVLHVDGDVRTRGKPLQSGSTVAPGDELRTGQDGHVRLMLADGMTVSLLPSSIAEIEAPSGDVQLRLDAGHLFAQVRSARHGGHLLRIRTRAASVSAGNALFRAVADASRRSTTVEVIDGSVAVSDSGGHGKAVVVAGFGTRVTAGNAPLPPRPLLAGPKLWTGIQLVERKDLEIPFNPLKEATVYRIVISPGADLGRTLVDDVSHVARIRVPELPDGDYFVRARGVDELGIEGHDTLAQMKVQLRADPPSLAHPPDRATIFGRSAEFTWLADPGAKAYVAQIAPDATFRSRSREWTGLREPRVTANDLAPGIYYWRVASLRKDGSESRFSAIRSLRLRPPPVPPAAPRIENGVMHFAWSGEAGQTFLLQLAADPRFEYVVAERRGDAASADVPRPEPGVYYARVRATEADGSIGPFTDAIRIDIPRASAQASSAGCLIAGERGLCAVYAPARRGAP